MGSNGPPTRAARAVDEAKAAVPGADISCRDITPGWAQGRGVAIEHIAGASEMAKAMPGAGYRLANTSDGLTHREGE
jgi:hypothetical protein